MAYQNQYGEKKMESGAFLQNSVTYNFDWIGSHAGKRCDMFERSWLNCASAVGLNRANVECKVEFSDLKECQNMDIAYKRYNRMQEERQKKGLSYLEPPPIDTLPYHKFKNIVF